MGNKPFGLQDFKSKYEREKISLLHSMDILSNVDLSQPFEKLLIRLTNKEPKN